MSNNPALCNVHGLLLCVRVCGSSLQDKAGDGVVLMLLANKLDQADGGRAVTALQGQKLAEVKLL